jgi:hypothetical protein
LGYLEGDHFGICDCLVIPRAIQPGWIDKAVTIFDIEEIVRHQFLRRAKFLSPIGSSACAYPLVTVRLCIVRSNLEATMTAVKKTAKKFKGVRREKSRRWMPGSVPGMAGERSALNLGMQGGGDRDDQANHADGNEGDEGIVDRHPKLLR